MAVYYADSSALIKRHVPEAGAAWFSSLAVPTAGNLLITSQLSLVEIYSALNRRVREATTTPADYQRILADLNHSWTVEYEIIALASTVIDEARLLLERHPLRASDAVQLASALQSRRLVVASSSAAPVFLCADNRLLNAARAEDFVTDNPNDH